MKLAGRVALVTGASQGIGHACALALAREGATIAAAARNREKLDELVAAIAAAGGQAAAFVIDVADEDQIKSGVKQALAQFGKIDILVNNAGITRDQLVMRMKRADWDAVLNTNLTSAYLCIQQVIGSMLKQRWGRIVNITSIFGQTGQAGQANYAASKAVLIGLTMAMAREVASRNITVNAVAPGFIETSMTAALSEEFKQTAVKQIPLGRVGSRRHRQRRLLPRLRRSLLHHRPRPQRERRNANGIVDPALTLRPQDLGSSRAGGPAVGGPHPNWRNHFLPGVCGAGRRDRCLPCDLTFTSGVHESPDSIVVVTLRNVLPLYVPVASEPVRIPAQASLIVLVLIVLPVPLKYVLPSVHSSSSWTPDSEEP